MQLGQGLSRNHCRVSLVTEHHQTIPSTSIVSSAATPKTRLYEEAQPSARRVSLQSRRAWTST